jgi:hypothetical protein
MVDERDKVLLSVDKAVTDGVTVFVPVLELVTVLDPVLLWDPDWEGVFDGVGGMERVPVPDPVRVSDPDPDPVRVKEGLCVVVMVAVGVT